MPPSSREAALAHALAKNDPQAQVTVFLMADAVLAAKAGQKTPEGFYNVERMLKRVIAGKGQVLLCGTCLDARGMTEADSCRAPAAAPWTNWQPRPSLPTKSWCYDMISSPPAANRAPADLYPESAQ